MYLVSETLVDAPASVQTRLTIATHNGEPMRCDHPDRLRSSAVQIRLHSHWGADPGSAFWTLRLSNVFKCHFSRQSHHTRVNRQHWIDSKTLILLSSRLPHYHSRFWKESKPEETSFFETLKTLFHVFSHLIVGPVRSVLVWFSI